jgi:hypothetical protein
MSRCKFVGAALAVAWQRMPTPLFKGRAFTQTSNAILIIYLAAEKRHSTTPQQEKSSLVSRLVETWEKIPVHIQGELGEEVSREEREKVMGQKICLIDMIVIFREGLVFYFLFFHLPVLFENRSCLTQLNFVVF